VVSVFRDTPRRLSARETASRKGPAVFGIAISSFELLERRRIAEAYRGIKLIELTRKASASTILRFIRKRDTY